MSASAAELLASRLRAVSLGLETLALARERAGVPVTHVDWRPRGRHHQRRARPGFVNALEAFLA